MFSDELVFNTSEKDSLEVKNKVIEIVKNNSDEFYIDSISIDSNLIDISIDSIGFIKIIVTLEEYFDIEFDDDMLLFNAFPNVLSIAEYVESKINNG